MSLLDYDFRVINANALAEVLASNERRIAQHNARVSRLTGTPVSGGRLPAARQQDSHVRARAAQETALARAATSLDRQRAAALMALHRATERQRMASERTIQRESMRLDRQRASEARRLERVRINTRQSFQDNVARERRAIGGAVTGRTAPSESGLTQIRAAP